MKTRRTLESAPGSRRRAAAGGLRERRKADIRSRLFRAAFKLFVSHGFNATTVEDITQLAGVAKGTFFNYFPTKEHLLTAFAERRLDIMRTAREKVLRTRKPVRDVLHELAFAMAEEPGESRAMARCMLINGLGSEPMTAMVGTTMAEGRRILTEVISAGQQRDEIGRRWSAEDLAGLFQNSFFGTLYRWTLDPHLNLASCLDTTFSLFWAAVEFHSDSATSKKRSS